LEAAVGVRALDDYTLEIRLNEPWAALPGLLAFWPALPVRQDLIERYGTNWTQPGYYTGNGPFRLVRWDYQNRIVLEPNRQYSGPAPTLQQITFYMNPDQDDELAAFRRGDQDIVALPLDIGVDKLSNPLYQPYLLRYGDLASYGLRLNTARSPFDRLGARRALSLGIDREALVKQVFGGVGRPAYGWAPPGIPGHDSSLAGRWRWDPATAQKELASAGVPSFPATPPLVLPHATTGTGLRLSEFVRDQIQPNLHLGVQMYPNTVRGMQESYSRGQYNLMPFAWVANYPDADPRSWARGLFTAEAAQSEESLMPAASGLMRQARVEQDSARRTDLWRQAQIVAAEDASLVFLYHWENLALVRPTIKGLQPTVMDGGFPGRYFFSQIRIEE
jgi:ABC-type oligopeptide transport system substrate-binding subunit